MIVILGAGLTGLSCAYHLGDAEYRLFEAEARPGGLCRSRVVRGFTFDCTGHLLHLRDEYVKRLILEEMLPGVFASHPRRASIYTMGRFAPYPFQANFYGMPRQVVRECLLGFLRATPKELSASFEEWALATFGEGIYKHFLRPYNEKLWRVPLHQLTHDWCSWSVPRPSLEQIVDGALGFVNRNMGYNPSFYYPRRGGIEVLPAAFAQRCHHLETGQRAVSVDVRKRLVRFAGGGEVRYDRLVSTLPLDDLLANTVGGSDEWHSMAARLKRVSILALNLGVQRRFWGGRQWVYFPEADYPFYRVGVASNFESTLAPDGCSNLYVEVSLDSPNVDLAPIVRRCLEKLRSLGLRGRILVKDTLVIPCAYVVYDRARQEVVPRALAQLRAHGILSTGRYGAWQYSYMERAILEGREAARWCFDRDGPLN